MTDNDDKSEHPEIAEIRNALHQLLDLLARETVRQLLEEQSHPESFLTPRPSAASSPQ